MVIAMLAWVFRFGLFAYGNPAGNLWMIILSCIVYGMAFDFFNISGSLFVETSTTPAIRSSAQGLFMMMTNGVGAVLGSLLSGWMIDRYFTHHFTDANATAAYLDTTTTNPHFLQFLEKKQVVTGPDGVFQTAIAFRDWQHIWLTFTVYALTIAILFSILFKHKHMRTDRNLPLSH
jgi:NHS family xanthosine MFS transporter